MATSTVLAVIFATLVYSFMAIRGSKRTKLENDESSLEHSSQPSEDDFVYEDDVEVAQAPPKRKSKGALRREDGESSVNVAGTTTKDHFCRFCPMKFDKSQALGGHMNRHRIEREQEEFRKAQDLIIQRGQYHSGTSWNMLGAGAGTLYHNGNLLPNPPAAGASSRPYFPSNQSPPTLHNWQMAQILARQQSSAYSLQSAPQASGGSYYDQLDNAKAHHSLPSQTQAQQTIGVHLPAHQQLHVNPGQHPVPQTAFSDAKPTLQSGANIAGLQSGPLIGHLEDNVNMGQTNPQGLNNNSMASFIQHTCQNSIQFVDRYGNIPTNSCLLPLNDTHFQPGQGQEHNFQGQHYISYNQKPGTSDICSLGSNANNQALESRILHMQSFQDSTVDHDNFQGGNDQSTIMVKAGQASHEGSPDISSDGKSQQ